MPSVDNSLKSWQICDTVLPPCTEWKNINESTFLQGTRATYQLRTELPENPATISFITNSLSISVADQNNRLYKEKYNEETNNLYLISIQHDSRILYITVEQEHFNPADIVNYTFSGQDSQRTLFNHIINLGFIGAFLTIIGIYAIIFSLRSGRKEITYFGFFSAFAGINALANSPLSHYLWFYHEYALIPKIRVVTFYGGNLFLFLFIEKMLGKGPYDIFAKFNYLLITITSLFLTLTLFRPELNNYLNVLYLPVTLAGGIFLLGWIFYLAYNKNIEARIIFTGGLWLIFLQFGVYLNKLGYLPWLISFDWAIFLFIISLGTLLVRRSYLLRIHLEEIAAELGKKNTALIKSALEKEKLLVMEKEMEIAKKIQFSIIPELKPSTKNIRTAMRYIPAELVGGDFFDFFVDDDRIGILVTDVSGHGFSSALIASMIKISFHASEKFRDKPGQMLSEMNRLLHDKLKHNFLTATYAMIEPSSNRLVLANAGHPPLFIHKRLTTGEVLAFNAPGKVIGFDLQIDYDTVSIEITPGDRLLFLTDGILECENSEYIQFEEKRLSEFLISHSDIDPEAFCDQLIEKLQQWSGKENFSDDVTLVVIDIV